MNPRIQRCFKWRFGGWSPGTFFSLDFSVFGIPVWKNFEYFAIFLFEKTLSKLRFSVWIQCLKILEIFHDFLCLKGLWIFYYFLCLKSPSEKTLNISWFFLSVWNLRLKRLWIFTVSLSGILVWRNFEYFVIFSVWNPYLKRL